jgi:predicted aspartyl protease
MMRRAILAAALLLFGPPAQAEPIEVHGNRLFIPVEINGEPVVALLDSGAEMTVLDDAFAQRLGLLGMGEVDAHGSGAESVRARFAGPVSIRAAGVALEERPVAVIDLSDVAARLIGRPLPMILGRDLFDAARLRIDIAEGTIDVAQQEVEPAGIRLPLTGHRGIETFPVEVEGHGPIDAALDFGNGSEVMIGRALADRIGASAPERIVGRQAGGGIGGQTERQLVSLSRLVVAGREFRDVPAAIDESSTAADLNIGTSILRDFVATTDFTGRTLWLEPRP